MVQKKDFRGIFLPIVCQSENEKRSNLKQSETTSCVVVFGSGTEKSGAGDRD
jgi:hypothetical protein